MLNVDVKCTTVNTTEFQQLHSKFNSQNQDHKFAEKSNKLIWIVINKGLAPIVFLDCLSNESRLTEWLFWETLSENSADTMQRWSVLWSNELGPAGRKRWSGQTPIVRLKNWFSLLIRSSDVVKFYQILIIKNFNQTTWNYVGSAGNSLPRKCEIARRLIGKEFQCEVRDEQCGRSIRMLGIRMLSIRRFPN